MFLEPVRNGNVEPYQPAIRTPHFQAYWKRLAILLGGRNQYEMTRLHIISKRCKRVQTKNPSTELPKISRCVWSTQMVNLRHSVVKGLGRVLPFLEYIWLHTLQRRPTGFVLCVLGNFTQIILEWHTFILRPMLVE